jgi:hypothetical protein
MSPEVRRGSRQRRAIKDGLKRRLNRTSRDAYCLLANAFARRSGVVSSPKNRSPLKPLLPLAAFIKRSQLVAFLSAYLPLQPNRNFAEQI